MHNTRDWQHNVYIDLDQDNCTIAFPMLYNRNPCSWWVIQHLQIIAMCSWYSDVAKHQIHQKEWIQFRKSVQSCIRPIDKKLVPLLVYPIGPSPWVQSYITAWCLAVMIFWLICVKILLEVKITSFAYYLAFYKSFAMQSISFLRILRFWDFNGHPQGGFLVWYKW